MSKIEVNAIEPQSGTTLTLGASGDTITIPSGATINNQGSAVNFGPTGAVSWNTTKITANPNPAVSGVGYFCDTTSAAFTVTLPLSPSAGAVVGIADYANTFATNNLTVGRNGSNIGGSAINAVLSTNGVSVTFVYVDATQGWIVTDSGNRSDLPTPQFVAATGGTVTTCGNFKIHSFTGPGTFTVSNAGNAQGSNSVDYLVVAGGGGGGSGPDNAAAGGAGGFRLSNFYGLPAPTTSPLANPANLPVSVTGYPITVGSGGAGAPTTAFGTPGNPSIFSTITSTGGGGGGYREGPPSGNGAGLTGGSGGGGGSQAANPGAGGTGNTPPTSPSQGNNGGLGISDNLSFSSTGGGGGAGANGTAGTPSSSGPGGIGSFVSPSFAVACAGTPGPAPGVRYFAGGGGGGKHPAATGGAGGAGGGGAGSSSPTPSVSGTTNTGGGGGGGESTGGFKAGASGGSGIVIIRYKFQ
jgi:hypothetical protein